MVERAVSHASLADPAVSRTGFSTLITENRRVEILRRTACLTIRVTGNALTEPEARRVGIDHLDSGEQLLACIERDGTAALSYTFTFVIWPRISCHTTRIVDQLRSVA